MDFKSFFCFGFKCEINFPACLLNSDLFVGNAFNQPKKNYFFTKKFDKICFVCFGKMMFISREIDRETKKNCMCSRAHMSQDDSIVEKFQCST